MGKKSTCEVTERTKLIYNSMKNLIIFLKNLLCFSDNGSQLKTIGPDNRKLVNL